MQVFVIVLLVHIVYCLGDHWSYSEQELWPTQCLGTNQSPIAVSEKDAVSTNMDPFQFSSSYYRLSEATLTNTGHSVEVKLLESQNPPKIIRGGLKDEYVLTAFHFHWGSEHVVDGYRYPLEGHFVHYAQKYGNLTSALNYQDGIAVVAVFYEVSEKPNFAFTSIFPLVPKVAHNLNTPVALRRLIRVVDYLPVDTYHFFRYTGSLTTPNCNEAVIWTIFTQPSFISRPQLELFTQIWTEEDQLLEVNYRELQGLNGRQVYFVEPNYNKIMWK